MTRLLAFVPARAKAAEAALAAGADIIALHGAAGLRVPAEPEAVRAATVAIGGRRPIAAPGADFVLREISPGLDLAAAAALARPSRPIAVLFADRQPRPGLLPLLKEAGFLGVMIDVADLSRGRLLDFADLPQLRRFVAEARGVGLLVGMAGALEAPDIPRLLMLEPDFLGIEATGLTLARILVPREAPVASGVDYSLLERERPAPPDEAGHDRIFLRDFVLPVHLGAYSRERGAPQRVRFDIEVAITRPSRPSQDMRDIVSYDLIRDAIALVTASGHIALAETLAEQIAAVLLASHPRIVNVALRLEKLDAGPGTVGIAIERTRASAAGARILHLPAAAP